VLPLGPTGYGDSPYQCFSAFAGNPLLISLERLIEDGLLTETEVRSEHPFRSGNVDFPAVIAHRRALWPRVLARFEAAPAQMHSRFDNFCGAHASWLDDFALFMAVKDAQGQVAGPSGSPTSRTARHRQSQVVGALRSRDPVAQTHAVSVLRTMATRARHLSREIDSDHGDLPIFVAHDSAECLGATRVVPPRF
jgi:4-alpha-glucanotransferase